MNMSGLPSQGLRWVIIVALVLIVLPIVPGPTSALPGDLTVVMELEEDILEARPEEAADTVTFHGNLTFDQPRWQYASARLTVDSDRNWTVSASPTTVTNRGPGTQSFTVTMEVPPSARGGEMAKIEVVATYSTRFGGSSTTSDLATVTVRPWVGYRINVTDAVELVLPQGTSGVLRVPLRNVGNVGDTFASSVPYWYGLRPLGVTVESPGPLTVGAKEEVELEFPISAALDSVPRMYVFEMVVDAASLPRGGEGASEDPRVVRAEVHVTGIPPSDDPYDVWSPGTPSEPLSRWSLLFGASAPRHNPDVDPTGTHIVYEQPNGETREIYLGDASGSGTRPVTRGHVDHHPLISTNGQMVAFARAPDRILIINHNGTELMEFGTEFGWVNLTDWSASSDRLLFDASGNIYELDLRYNTTRRLTGEPVDQWGAVYSADGGRIYYLSFEAAGPMAEVWSMTSDGAAHRQLTFNELEERSVSVSPNGNKLAFTLEAPGGRGDRVCVMSADGSEVRFFSDLSRQVFVLRWHPDGDAVLAEVSPLNMTAHDIERIPYPWKDAGASGGGGGGGNGGGGGSGSDWWNDITGGYGNYVVLIIVVVLVVALVGNHYRLKGKRGKEAAADELRRKMEAGDPQRPPPEDDWGRKRFRSEDYGGKDTFRDLFHP